MLRSDLHAAFQDSGGLGATDADLYLCDFRVRRLCDLALYRLTWLFKAKFQRLPQICLIAVWTIGS